MTDCYQRIEQLDPDDYDDLSTLLYIATAALQRASTSDIGGSHAAYRTEAVRNATIARNVYDMQLDNVPGGER